MAEAGRKLLRRELFDSRRARPAVRHDAGGIDETVLAAFRSGEPMGAAVVSQPDRAGTDTLVGAEERPVPGVGRAIHFILRSCEYRWQELLKPAGLFAIVCLDGTCGSSG